MNEFKRGVESLDETQLAFIEKELGISPDKLFQMNDDEIDDLVYDPLCWIEIREVMDAEDGPESERCCIASDIVTILGNSLR